MKTKRLFLVGAPKCGTTSLAYWLGRHSQVQLALNKEPGFFRTGERKWVLDAHHPDQFEAREMKDYMSDLSAYEELFCKAAPNVWRLDASTDYFSDRGSCERIKEALRQDDIKVVCLLRDPIARMYSEYRHTLRDNLEVLSFQDALDAEEERIAKGYQPLFFHKDRSRYWMHITRWRTVFGTDNFMTLSFSELSNSAALQKKMNDFFGNTGGRFRSNRKAKYHRARWEKPYAGQSIEVGETSLGRSDRFAPQTTCRNLS